MSGRGTGSGAGTARPRRSDGGSDGGSDGRDAGGETGAGARTPPAASLPFDPVAEARRRWVAEGWEDAAAGMAAVTSVMRAQQILLARIDEQLRDLELTFARYELLMLLLFSRAGALPMAVIGSRLQVHPTSVTSAVDRLERQGLVARAPHPTDRRTKLASLTDEGRERALAATARLNATVFADPGLAPDDVEGLVDLLRVLRRHAGDF